MIIRAIKTRRFLPPNDDILSLLKESFKNKKIREKSIIVIASKIVSIGEGRCVKIEPKTNKDKLIKKEADFYSERKETPKRRAILTIKNNILMPSAGIDRSNSNGYFILLPKKPFLSARKIHQFIKKIGKIKKLGIIIADSRTTPLRRGTLGVAIAWWGFNPLKNYASKTDLFGWELGKFQSNVADSMAIAAVSIMGESNEQTPIAIIKDVNFVKFEEDKAKSLAIGLNKDFYKPLLKGVNWKKGSGAKK